MVTHFVQNGSETITCCIAPVEAPEGARKPKGAQNCGEAVNRIADCVQWRGNWALL